MHEQKKNLLLEIDQKTLKETVCCDNDFECLRNENYACKVARVDRCIGGTILFMNCTKHLCPYKIGFGNGTICNSPTR